MVVVMVFAFMFHNIFQTWVASRYGDSTPQMRGFLSFEPQQHINPMGLLLLVLLGFGWPNQITLNSQSFRGKEGQEAMVWYAGPMAYLIVAFACVLLGYTFNSFGNRDLFVSFLHTSQIATLHAIINLFPLLPLDGGYAQIAVGNPTMRRFMAWVGRFGILGFIVFFMLMNILGVTKALMNLVFQIFQLIISLIPGLL
jgi:Zn-dependent protease